MKFKSTTNAFPTAEELRELENDTRLYSKIREEAKERITYSMKNAAEKLGLSTVTIHFEGKPHNKAKLAVFFEIKKELEAKGHHVVLTGKAHGGEGLLPSHLEFQLKIEWTEEGMEESKEDQAIQMLLSALAEGKDEVFIQVKEPCKELEGVMKSLKLQYAIYTGFIFIDDKGNLFGNIGYKVYLE